MSRRRLLWGLVVFLNSCCLAVLAADGAFGAPLPDDCMPASEIRPGMIGEARSVLNGFTVEGFKVEILGVEENALPGSPLILGRLDGKSLENHGVVAGMSGSPVYVNGKVIGAVAYGWTFAYHPYCGITPIEQMLSVWSALDRPASGGAGVPPAGRKGAKSGSVGGTAWNWESDWKTYLNVGETALAGNGLEFRPRTPEVVQALGEGPISMTPLSSPLLISGVSEGSLSRLQKFFGSRGLEVMGAGSNAGSSEDPAETAPPIVNGSALGVPIVSGDISMGTIGTVTYRSGDKLVAFGHPMFSEGECEAPMAQARIFGFMQSYARSFKLGQTREIVGTIRQDREFGIGGVFGSSPPRVPVHVRVGGEAASRPRDYRYSIWENRNFLPMASAITLQESFTGSISEGGELTTECRYAIHLTDGQTIAKTLRNSSRSGGSFEFSMNLLQDMFLLIENPYRQAKVESIDAEISARPGFRTDRLVQTSARYSALRPGETLEMETVWRPYRGPEYTRSLSLQLPGDLRDGYYLVHVADSDGSLMIDRRHQPILFQPYDFQETVDLAKRLDYPDNRLRVYLFEPDMSLGLRSDSFEGAPGTVRNLIAASSPVEMQSMGIGKRLMVQETEFDYPIAGRASLLIRVARYLPK